jgi:hypothetical protein
MTQVAQPVELNGISDEQVIQVAKELLESAGVREFDRLPIDSREDAIIALLTVCKVAERFDVKAVFQMEIKANERDLAARVTA